MRFSTIILATCLTLAACAKPISVGIPAPPAERLTCEAMPAPPSGLTALRSFVAGNDGVPTYHKSEVDARDALIAAWVLALRDAHFSCFDDVSWLRQYYEAQE